MVSNVPNLHLGINKNYKNSDQLIFLRVYVLALYGGRSAATPPPHGQLGLNIDDMSY